MDIVIGKEGRDFLDQPCADILTIAAGSDILGIKDALIALGIFMIFDPIERIAVVTSGVVMLIGVVSQPAEEGANIGCPGVGGPEGLGGIKDKGGVGFDVLLPKGVDDLESGELIIAGIDGLIPAGGDFDDDVVAP